MPIEREFKYVLRSPEALLARLRKTPGLHGQADIQQGYLSKGGRIRRRTWWRRNGESFFNSFEVARVEHIFTYKHDLSNRPGVLEIETEISKDDFDLAWHDADHRITKTRFLIDCQATGGVWEIDFFKDPDGIYLALAELEVPADAGPPDRLHPLVQEYLVYSVPEGDSRFANRKLCTRERVQELLKEIA